MGRKRRTSVSGRFHALLNKHWLSFVHVPEGEITSKNPITIILSKHLMLKYWIYRGTNPATIIIIEARPLTMQRIERLCTELVSTLVEQEMFGIMVDRCGNTSILDGACIQEACPIIGDSKLVSIDKPLFERLLTYYDGDESKLGLYILTVPEPNQKEDVVEEDEEELDTKVDNELPEFANHEVAITPDDSPLVEDGEKPPSTHDVFFKNIKEFFKVDKPDGFSFRTVTVKEFPYLELSQTLEGKTTTIRFDLMPIGGHHVSQERCTQIVVSIEKIGDIARFVEMFMRWHSYLAEHFSGNCIYRIPRQQLGVYEMQILPPLMHQVGATEHTDSFTNNWAKCYISKFHLCTTNDIFTKFIEGETL